ncbi:MAG: 2-oxoglutarate and iron-dependent oxygenase domain-containing protein, partial [Alphaproteobacteria bacterium]
MDIHSLSGEEDIQQTADAIHAALVSTGFMYVTGHGIPQAFIDAAFAATKSFFAMPTAAKMALHISRSGDTMRGYTE